MRTRHSGDWCSVWLRGLASAHAQHGLAQEGCPASTATLVRTPLFTYESWRKRCRWDRFCQHLGFIRAFGPVAETSTRVATATAYSRAHAVPACKASTASSVLHMRRITSFSSPPAPHSSRRRRREQTASRGVQTSAPAQRCRLDPLLMPESARVLHRLSCWIRRSVTRWNDNHGYMPRRDAFGMRFSHETLSRTSTQSRRLPGAAADTGYTRVLGHVQSALYGVTATAAKYSKASCASLVAVEVASTARRSFVVAAASQVKPRMAEKARLRVNDEIPSTMQCLLVDTNGEALGTFSVADALQKASSRGLDLVEVAPKARPLPVCRLVTSARDVLSTRSAKAKQNMVKAARKTRQQVTKEIRLSPVTQSHDFALKMRRAREFLMRGLRVRVYILFRRGHGRKQQEAETLLVQARDALADIGQIQPGSFVESGVETEPETQPGALGSSAPGIADASPSAPVTRRTLDFVMHPLSRSQQQQQQQQQQQEQRQSEAERG